MNENNYSAAGRVLTPGWRWLALPFIHGAPGGPAPGGGGGAGGGGPPPEGGGGAGGAETQGDHIT